MSNGFRVDIESVMKSLECFESDEEIALFASNFASVCMEVTKIGGEVMKTPEEQRALYAAGGMMKQIALIVLFYRQNIELLQELIKTIKYEELE